MIKIDVSTEGEITTIRANGKDIASLMGAIELTVNGRAVSIEEKKSARKKTIKGMDSDD